MDEDLSMPSTVYYTISAAGCQVRSSPAQVNLRTLGIRRAAFLPLSYPMSSFIQFSTSFFVILSLRVWFIQGVSQEYLNGVVFS